MHRFLPHLLVLAFAATSQAQLTNAFTTTTESWRKIEYNPGNNSFNTPVAANFTAVRGNPPGALSATDSAGTYYAFWAPDEYLNDQSGFLGGEIIVDLSNAATSSRNAVEYTIALRSASGLLASYVAPVQPGTAWSTSRVPLVGSLGWTNLTTNAPLTDTDLENVLGELTGISIMGDFVNGTDTTDVDNFYLGPKLTPTPIEFFNTDAGSWTIITTNDTGTSVPRKPSAPTYDPLAGNTGGAIQTADVDTSLTYALAPRTFTGTWTDFEQGEISFDIKNTPGSGGGPLSETYSVATLTGGKTTFHYVLPTRGLTLPTVWTTVFIPMQPSPNWHVATLDGPQPTNEQFSRMLEYVDGLRIRLEYVDGSETDFLDNVTLLPKHPVPTIVSGHVDLGGAYSGSPDGVSVRVGFFRESWPMGEVTTTLDSNGNYSVVCPSYGNVTVTCKGSHWLRSTQSASFPANGTPRTVDFSLINGDVDDDNSVTLFDYLILSDAFDTELGNAGYVAQADLDGDGVIGLFDYLILSENFDQQGTPFE